MAGEVQAPAIPIRTGPAAGLVDREPVYATMVASRTVPDWGNTYVEMDLIEQHVYTFQEGSLTWDTSCVTGNISKNHDTPAGIYSLTYREKGRVLRGTKKVDGTYEHESYVDYRVSFNGGAGFHGAIWRNKLSGIIFQTSGSYGCINFPPEEASVPYDLTYKGTPVLYYR